MAGDNKNPLLQVLREPESLGRLDLGDWDLLLRQSRRHKLTGHLAYLAAKGSDELTLPVTAKDRFLAMNRFLAFLHQQDRRQIRVVREQCPSGSPLLLLKGCGYLAADLPHARGRLISDVDLLVPADQLPQLEQQLKNHGWRSEHSHPYDQRYYREWMHEIPALTHPDYELELDLHHQILPPVSRFQIPPEQLWRQARELGDGLWIFSPADMLLHCAAHLIQEGKPEFGLRDLVDIDQMLRRFSSEQADFQSGLLQRSEELGLSRPLGHALHCCRALLHTPLAPCLSETLLDSPTPGERWVRSLALQVFSPIAPDRPLPPLSTWLLYVRGHWLRMPPLRLGNHLVRKSWRRLMG